MQRSQLSLKKTAAAAKMLLIFFSNSVIVLFCLIRKFSFYSTDELIQGY